MRATSLLIVMALAGAAVAQPGQTPPTPPAPYAPPPQSPPAPYPVAPPYPVQPIELSAQEYELLEDGEISDGAHIGGGLANIFIGFGIGQAVQGRWSETGWIFTLGEIGSYAAMMYGMFQVFEDCFYDCSDNDNDHGATYLVGGAIGLTAFRIWSIVDAFGEPPRHNRRVRELRMRLGMPPQPYYGLYLAPPRQGDGGVVGLGIRF